MNIFNFPLCFLPTRRYDFLVPPIGKFLWSIAGRIYILYESDLFKALTYSANSSMSGQFIRTHV